MGPSIFRVYGAGSVHKLICTCNGGGSRATRRAYAGADPGFLEREFMGGRLADYIYFLKKSHENEIIWSKLFHFHRIFKNGGGGRTRH